MTALHFCSALLSTGWAENVRLTLDGGRIVRVETGATPGPDDECHQVVLPGLCNVHSHGFQRGMAGLAERRGPEGDNFWTWREVMYRFLDRLTPEDVEAITALAFMEMLERGFTRVGEFHYLHHDPGGTPYANIGELAERVAAAADETGIGLTLLPVFYAHGNFGGAAPSPGQRRFLNSPDAFARLFDASRKAIAALDDADIGVAPHSLRAVTPDELRAAIALSPDGPVHIHAAEQTKEVEDCMAWSGTTPVAWLLDNASVDRRWCLVHATHMTGDETARLAASGAVAGLCPVTEANLGDGIFPTERYLAAEGAFGLGTDSNIAIDPAQELRMLEYAQRLSGRSRNVLASREGVSTGRELVDRARKGGARALGQRLSGIAEGAAADFFTLDSQDSLMAGRRNDTILDSWVFATARPVVDCVWRGGRKTVAGGEHRHRAAITARYLRSLERLLA
ncbi:MAG: formimidoylglutamate deiminase [Alphaproteobacteria bacterium]|nr:formimidoylglutamate deiminase [Alphaproteobacteria bacterium]